jgi:hypothetical protein
LPVLTTVSLAAQGAIETLPKDKNGRPRTTLEIHSNYGSGYISKEFRLVLKENGLELFWFNLKWNFAWLASVNAE